MSPYMTTMKASVEDISVKARPTAFVGRLPKKVRLEVMDYIRQHRRPFSSSAHYNQLYNTVMENILSYPTSVANAVLVEVFRSLPLGQLKEFSRFLATSSVDSQHLSIEYNAPFIPNLHTTTTIMSIVSR